MVSSNISTSGTNPFGQRSNLTPTERTSYIDALKCLASQPSRTSPDLASGARNRVDDFAVAHILKWQELHFSPNLLPWHRHFIWEWEQALRNECGWAGGIPFWDWSKGAERPLEENPIFDGSATSLSGNGELQWTRVDRGRRRTCQCVTSGPLANWTVNLGPSAPGFFCSDNPQADGLGHNPRCLERGFGPQYMRNITYAHVSDTILNHDIQARDGRDSFFLRIETWPNGIHPIPHSVVGGLQNDIPSSSTDPWFFLHHAALDRAWAIWQSIDFEKRKDATGIAEDYTRIRAARGWAPATPVTSHQNVHLSPVFQDVTVADVMDTTGGKYCYRYD